MLRPETPVQLYKCLDQRNVSCVQSEACRTLYNRQSQSNMDCCGSEPCVHRPPDAGYVVGKVTLDSALTVCYVRSHVWARVFKETET